MISPKGQNFSAAKSHEISRNKSSKTFVTFRVNSWLNVFQFSLILTCAFFLCAATAAAQTKKSSRKTPATKKQPIANLPKVTQIDAEQLKNLLKPNGKPLLINFWATWCDPCREEFPDLVKIATDYKGKLDLLTVSLDDLADIDGDVPKFLAQMKSDSPAYLLKVPDEGEAIAVVSKDWQGGLPFTILLNASGETIYSKQGKFKTDLLRAEIDKSLTVQLSTTAADIQTLIWSRVEVIHNTDIPYENLTYEQGQADARTDIADGRLTIKRTERTSNSETDETLRELKEKYSIEFDDYGCSVSDRLLVYVKGYNEISKAEIQKKFGDVILTTISRE